jgi:hypothetical protein
LRVSENKVLRRIFGPDKGEVIGGWRKLLEELLSPPNISDQIYRKMRLAGHIAHVGGMRNAYKTVQRPEGKTPFGRPWCRLRMIVKWILKKCGKTRTG